MKKVFQITISEYDEVKFNGRKYKVSILPLNIIKTRLKDKKGKRLWRIKPTKIIHTNQCFIPDISIARVGSKNVVYYHIRELFYGLVEKLIEEVKKI